MTLLPLYFALISPRLMPTTPPTDGPRRRRSYNAAYKAAAVCMARSGPTARHAAQQMGISEKLLYRWQQAQGRTEAAATRRLLPPGPPTAGDVPPGWLPGYYDHPADQPLRPTAAVGRRLAAAVLPTQGLYLHDRRAGRMVFVSPGIGRLLGYPLATCTADFLAGLIHPDDLALVADATALVNRFILEQLPAEPLGQLVFSVDYRLRHAQGHWLRVLRQTTLVARDPNGAVVAAASILTNISAHKHTHDVRFHLNHPGFVDFLRHEQRRTLPQGLSEREQEVLLLMLEGLSSRQIGLRLFIHSTTVQTHRRNIQRKTGSHNLHHLLRHLNTEAG